jgi:hypothetical protein
VVRGGACFVPLVSLSLSLSLSTFISFGRQFLTVHVFSFKRAGRDEPQQCQFFTVRFRSSKPAGREQQQRRITENGKRLICSREEREEKQNKTKQVCGERVLEFEVRRSFSLHFALCLCNNRDFVRRGGGIYNRSVASCIIDDFRTCVFYLLLIIATILDRLRERERERESVCVCVCVSFNKYALPKFFLMFQCFRRISEKVPESLLSRGIEALNCEERIVRLQLFSSSSFARLL